MNAKKSNGNWIGCGCLALLVVFVIWQVIGQALIVPAVINTNVLVGKAVTDSVARNGDAATASSDKIDQAAATAGPFVRLVVAFIATIAAIMSLAFGVGAVILMGIISNRLNANQKS